MINASDAIVPQSVLSYIEELEEELYGDCLTVYCAPLDDDDAVFDAVMSQETCCGYGDADVDGWIILWDYGH